MQITSTYCSTLNYGIWARHPFYQSVYLQEHNTGFNGIKHTIIQLEITNLYIVNRQWQLEITANFCIVNRQRPLEITAHFYIVIRQWQLKEWMKEFERKNVVRFVQITDKGPRTSNLNWCAVVHTLFHLLNSTSKILLSTLLVMHVNFTGSA